uniref:Uncharacterized protein n=1 Tax=Populus trichocarpa TaxID=3694 RepID=B9H8C4_POPTR
MAAEMWAVFHGLDLIWRLGFRHVELEVLARHWTIRVRHVFQKSLRGLTANFGHEVSLGTHHFKSPMKSLSALLYADMIGVTIPLITRLQFLLSGLRDPIVIMN